MSLSETREANATFDHAPHCSHMFPIRNLYNYTMTIPQKTLLFLFEKTFIRTKLHVFTHLFPILTPENCKFFMAGYLKLVYTTQIAI